MTGNNYFEEKKNHIVSKKYDKLGLILIILGILIFGYKFYGRLIPINSEIFDSVAYHSTDFEQLYESSSNLIIVCGANYDLVDKATNQKVYGISIESFYNQDEYTTLSSGLASVGYKIKDNIWYTLLNPALILGLAMIFFGMYRNFSNPRKHKSYEELTNSMQMSQSDRQENFLKHLSTGLGNKKDSNK